MARLARLVGIMLVAPCIGSLMAAGAEAKTVTLTLLMWDATAAYDRPTIDAFEKSHPGIKVKIVRGMDEKFLAMKAAGLPVDVFCNAGVYGWTTYIQNGLFEDLSPYYARDSKRFPADTIPMALTEQRFGSKLYGLVYGVCGSSAITYSKKLLDESGLAPPPSDWRDASWTWDRMVDYAVKMTKSDQNGKYKTLGFDTFDADNLIQFAWSFGGDWFPKQAYEDGYASKAAIDSAQNAAAYQALRDLRYKYRCRLGPETPGFSSRSWPDLLEGKAGMWLLPLEVWSAPQSKTKPLSKLGYAPMPIVPGVGRVDGFSWYGAMAMCKGTKYRNEAWTFIKWMTTDAATLGLPWPGAGARHSTWMSWFRKSGELYMVDAKQEQVIEGALTSVRAFPRCKGGPIRCTR